MNIFNFCKVENDLIKSMRWTLLEHCLSAMQKNEICIDFDQFDHKSGMKSCLFLLYFRQGLSDVIDLDWLRMFSYRELQTLISGADHEINIDDLCMNTKYGNGYTETHETIVNFWSVVKDFTEEQKRKLLKFVTSCSRPPLLGFKVRITSSML